ncbi:MAG: molecular chaperone [Pseudomonadales bacterium]
MYCGLDYGTSHCSIGLMRDGKVHLVPLEGDTPFIPSTLYAPRRNFEIETQDDAEGLKLDLTASSFAELRFGERAVQEHLQDPTAGYFIKSPKSFLGASGLPFEVQERFIRIVAAMIANVREGAQQHSSEELSEVVIGRPINFQGKDNWEANQQAMMMLAQAAREAGFEEVRFQYEPLAAALEFEADLESDKAILVVDIGGGTTDCSFVNVGPSYCEKKDRAQDVIGYAGERMGGNDYDQLLALKAFMPYFGLGSNLSGGLPLPNHLFVDTVSINDVNAQRRFYAPLFERRLKDYIRDGNEPAKIARLVKLREHRLTYRLARSAELAKIGLSDRPEVCVDLSYVEPGFEADLQQADYAIAVERLLDHLHDVVAEVLAQGARAPDLVYLTGGMAKSPVVRAFLDRRFPVAEYVDSDHFGSITEGLTIWASRVFS